MSDPKPRILIVDDEPDLLAVLHFGLEAEGFDVVEASDGERGLELARTVQPALIVLDLMLPRLDGYKVCRALKFDERYRNIPIFILSARSGETDRRLALDLGADAYMTKPYDMKDLVARIRARLDVAGEAAA
ncbi:MAG: response regulator [Candidatus Eisenbacteria bacterium]|uniref:Response regulator n=1 Tax=Eiseniibacteriota bacterium TaxID=2212470 RepID=A0A933SD94_UNCEI|nr:response regulator [Candidatus Eisenbacteria bacterium]